MKIEITDTLAKGDIVSINCNNGQTTISFKAKILYIPHAAGDSWRFRDLDTDDLIYISEGCTIIRKEGWPQE